jgi:hypothetical protein
MQDHGKQCGAEQSFAATAESRPLERLLDIPVLVWVVRRLRASQSNPEIIEECHLSFKDLITLFLCLLG